MQVIPKNDPTNLVKVQVELLSMLKTFDPYNISRKYNILHFLIDYLDIYDHVNIGLYSIFIQLPHHFLNLHPLLWYSYNCGASEYNYHFFL